MKKLSVIVPIYNAESYLQNCLDTIVNQTYQNKEIILVDDGSKDSSSKICDDYCVKYSFVKCIHKKNEGVMAARNDGIDVATGDYIALSDADDALDLDMYEILIKFIEETGSDVAACSFQSEYKKKFSVIHSHKETPPVTIYQNKKDSLTAILQKPQEDCLAGFVWNKVFTRKAVGTVRFRSDVAITDDLMFTWDTFSENVNRACFINLPMYHYRYLFSSITKNSSIITQIKALNAWNNIIRDCKENNLTGCYQYLGESFIVWNLKICEKMIFWEKPNMESYLLAKNNIEKYRTYIPLLANRHKKLAKATLISWKQYRKTAIFYYEEKKMYMKLKNI